MTERERNKRSVDGELGISRRDLLRRGAVVGGTVLWVTPVIQSMTRPALAQTTPTGGCFCIKVGPDGSECDDIQLQPVSNASCLFQTGDEGGCGQNVVVVSNDTWEVTLPEGCSLTGGCSKCGSAGCNCEVIPNGNTYTFSPCESGPAGEQAISHIEICFCCE